jgi:hypothetical protein
MKTPLHAYIIIRHGGMAALARKLNLANSTVHDWVHQNPRNALKYVREIAGPGNELEMVEAVYKQEAELLGA